MNFTALCPKWESLENSLRIGPVPQPPKFEAQAGTVVCPNCGARLSSTARTCENCGAKLPVQDLPAPPANDDSVTLDGSLPPSPVPSDETLDTGPSASRKTPSVRPLPGAPDFGPRYRVEGILGEGGMGTVYKAWDTEMERMVALKLIRRDLTADLHAMQRFKQELLLARKISHAHVLRIHDLRDGPGQSKFISMAYVEGQDLHGLLKKNGPLPLPRALGIARQLSSALSAAHSEGIVHRDLKPQNILIDSEGHIYVTDFGLAKSLESHLGMTRTGQFLGTPRYMSPEQAGLGDVDCRSDLYAFGLILCELLTGSLPFRDMKSTIELLFERAEGKPTDPKELNPDLPDYLARIIRKCLERDPNRRYQTAAEILEDLDGGEAPRELRPSRITVALPEVPALAKRAWPRRAAAGIILGLVVGGAVWLGYAIRRGRPGATASAGPQVVMAVLPLRNASGDTSLDALGTSLADILATDVGESGQLERVSPSRLERVLRQEKFSPFQTLDPSSARRLAAALGADHIVWGEYRKPGNDFEINLTVEDVRRGSRTALADSTSEGDLLSGLDRLAGDLRAHLGLSRTAIRQLAEQRFHPSTDSLMALAEFNRGLQFARTGNYLAAADRFEASTKKDPRFALAFAALAKTYASLGKDHEAQAASEKAHALAEQISPPEKAFVEATRQAVQRNYSKAIEAYDPLVGAAPGNADLHVSLGWLYENSSAYDQAREEYLKVLALDPESGDALLAMGRVEIDRGDPAKGLEYLTRAQAGAVDEGNDEERAEILQNMGVAYSGLAKPQDALRSLRDSLEIKRRLGLEKGIAMSLDAMAASEDALGNSDRALADFTEALSLERELGDKAGTGDLLNDLGQFYVDHGQYDKALKLFRESLQAEVEVGNFYNQAVVLNNIGNCYSHEADYQNARTFFEQALQLREKLKVPGDIADSLHNLAETSTQMGQYDRAVDQYLQALDLRRSSGDKRGAAIEASSMGILFGYQGRYGAALSSEADALKTFRDIEERGFWLAALLGYYGNALAQVGRNEEARKSLDEAQKVASELKNQSATAEILGYQGDNAYYRGDYRGAAPLYTEAFRAATRANDPDLVLISKFNVAKIANRQGHFKEAASALRELAQEADRMGLKYVSVECTLCYGEALMGLRSYEPARQELLSALERSQKLGLEILLAKSHYLLARDLELRGQPQEAREHDREARKILDDVRQEAKSDRIIERSDLAPIYSHAVRE